ncbi:GIY-YIG nuclease family protein [Candidatus Parcubacteria bacterium]|nr:GIY-YIG nuclease family protein [Candidatus Parcubacteria bacterium]
MWHVYILQCSDKTFYTGVTTSLKRRVEEHNTCAIGAKYTKGRRPVRLVFFKKFASRSQALKEECRIKKLNRGEKMNIINKGK